MNISQANDMVSMLRIGLIQIDTLLLPYQQEYQLDQVSQMHIPMLSKRPSDKPRWASLLISNS
jgi:hypothetical protein